MDAGELRYVVEHRFLPDELFREPAQIIGALSHKKEEFIWKLYEILSDAEKIENPYKKEDFTVQLYRLEEPWFMAQIIMPDPGSEPLCSRVYIVFGEEFKKVYYFTVEKGGVLQKDGKDEWFLCRWTDKKEHENYGKISGGEKEEVERIVELINKDGEA